MDDPRFEVTLGLNTYSFVWSSSAIDTVLKFGDLGFSEFEVMMSPPHISWDSTSNHERSRISALLSAQGLKIRSLNIPSLDHNLASPVRAVREYASGLFINAIDLLADLGGSHVVVVPGRLNPLFAPPQKWREEWIREGIDPIVAHAERRGITLAIENIPFACFPDALSLGGFVRSYRSDAMSVCYDAANAHFIGESPRVGLRELNDLVSVVHLSDTTRSAWRHDEIGLGDVPFSEVLEGLQDIRFRGPTMLEIIATDDPVNAMLRSRERLVRQGYPLSQSTQVASKHLSPIGIEASHPSREASS